MLNSIVMLIAVKKGWASTWIKKIRSDNAQHECLHMRNYLVKNLLVNMMDKIFIVDI
jgi:aminoglycoside/choline kinase family phosphotransferase